MMRTIPWVAVPLLAISLAGCDAVTPDRGRPLEVQTIEETTPRLAAVDPPPVLQDGVIPPRRLPVSPEEKGKSDEMTAEEEIQAKTNLPFTPHIAMDPVDGSKVSITVDTPVHLYKNKWYYFSSAANERAFKTNPEEYATGQLASY